jgi:hypothetical protein
MATTKLIVPKKTAAKKLPVRRFEVTHSFSAPKPDNHKRVMALVQKLIDMTEN